MNLHSLRRSHPSRAVALVLSLVLALLLLGGWGQVHRALHPASTAAAVLASGSAPVQASEQGSHHSHAGHPLGHESGGNLCVLLDHLADGAALTAALTQPPAFLPSTGLPLSAGQAAPLAAPRPFDARAPPPLA